MGHNLKTPKGEINVTNHIGRIRLRWRHNGERYSLNLPFAYTQDNLIHATVKVAEIKLDILKGCFDSSLQKYKPQATTKPVIIQHTKDEASTITKEVSTPVLSSLVTKFNEWGNHIKNIDVESSLDYLYVRKLLEKWVDIPLDRAAELLNKNAWAVSTYNRRLHYLKDFFGWLLGSGIISLNPLMKQQVSQQSVPLTS